MQKLLSMLTIGAFVSKTMPSTNIVLNTNSNLKCITNNMKNFKSDAIGNWKDLGKKEKLLE